MQGLAIVRITPHIRGIPVHGADRLLSLDTDRNAWVHGSVLGGSLAMDHLLPSSPLPLVPSASHDAWSKRSIVTTTQDKNCTMATSNIALNMMVDPPQEPFDMGSRAGSYNDLPAGFLLRREEAIALSRQHNAHQSVIHNPMNGDAGRHTPNFDMIARPMYLSAPGASLRPIWRIADSANLSSDRHLRYVDAQTGKIVATIPTVHHSHRGGRDVQSSNTCFAYTCANGAANGTCNESQSVCVDVDKNMVEGRDYFTATSYFITDGAFIDLDRNWSADGYINGTIYMAWKDAPVFAPRLMTPAPDNNGDFTWGTDVNFNTMSGTDPNDAFSELQTYHFLSNHAKYMRMLIGDPSLCIVGAGANCTTMDPHTNRTATQFDSPMRFVSNLQSIKTWPDAGSPYPDLLAQLRMGLGKNTSYPIMFYEHDYYADAYYSNSDFQPPMNNSEWRDCSHGACVSIQDSPLNYFAFGQASNSDWALNNCVVFHELTHAFVHKYIPDLPWVVWSPSGLKTDPGAMNEAWADYFAAIHCGMSDFRQTYNRHPLRDLTNSHTCANTVGEVHVDSMIFSGALWEVRLSIANEPSLTSDDYTLYDRVVLHAMMQGHATDLFETQLGLVMDLLVKHPKLYVLSDTALAVFSRRVFNCKRVSPISESSTTSFFLPTALTTPANMSTLPTQLEFRPRASDWGLSISWSQWYDSPILGPLTIGYGRTRLFALVSFECPIFLNGTANEPIVPYTSCGSASPNTSLSWTLADYHLGKTRGSLYIPFGSRGAPSVVYVWFAHQVPATMVMYSSQTMYYGFNLVWRITLLTVGALGVSVYIVTLITLAVMWGLARARRSRNTSTSSLEEQVADAGGTSVSSYGDRDLHGQLDAVAEQGSHQRVLQLGLHAVGHVYLGVTAGLHTGMVVLAALALWFGVVRDAFTYGILAIVVVVAVVDAVLATIVRRRGLVMTSSGCGVRTARIERTASGDSSVRQRGFPSMNTTRRSKIMSAMPSLQQQLIIAASVMGLAALAVVPMVFSLRAPMVAQGIVYALFCVSALLRQWLSLLIAWGLLRYGRSVLSEQRKDLPLEQGKELPLE
ncbi:hypothetical protein BSLG_000934 [Batrachochytrium salamandrivorans]|nr:hypothetical protein BSLG_000934 [Batrachochytrium salamandrivorans]